MFDNEINFLPPEMKSGKNQKQKKPVSLTKQKVPYTEPKEKFQEEPVSEKTAKPLVAKKPNFFKKGMSFFGRFLKSKKKKIIIGNSQKHFEQPVKKEPPNPNKTVEPLDVAKSVRLNQESKIQDISRVKPPATQAPQKREMPPNKVDADTVPEKTTTNFTAPSASEAVQHKEANVNLMPEDVAVNIDFKNKILVLVGGLVFVAVILGLSYLGIRLYSRSFIKDSVSTQEELLDIEKDINIYEEYRRESQNLSEKIDITFNLIKTHKHWSKLFPAIEGITHADVLYSNFMGDVSGQVALSPSAPGFKVLAQQILMLKDSGHIIENFDISGIGLISADTSNNIASGVAFNLTLKFNPDFFLASEVDTQN